MSFPIAVMLSGRGSNFAALLSAIASGQIDAHIVLVIADRNAAGLTLAHEHGIPTRIISKRDVPDLAAFDAENRDALVASGAKLVVLAGYLSIIGPECVTAFPSAILNVHPALLPSFGGPGYYGERVHQAVIDAGCKISGATVHLVTEEVDRGPIVDQASVPVYDDDDAHTLAARVLEQEHILLPRAVSMFVQGKIQIVDHRAIGYHPIP